MGGRPVRGRRVSVGAPRVTVFVFVRDIRLVDPGPGVSFGVSPTVHPLLTRAAARVLSRHGSR